MIYNSDKKLLEDMKNFLAKFGIVCYIYRFGKIFGLQIYRKNSIKTLRKIITTSVKISPLSG